MIIDQNETFKVVGFIKKLFTYLKTNAGAKMPFVTVFDNGTIYCKEELQRKFSVKGKLHFSKKTEKAMPNFTKWIMENKITIDLREFYEEAKKFKKADVTDGELTEDGILIRYWDVEYDTKGKTFSAEIINDINKKFDSTKNMTVQLDCINMSHEEYGNNEGSIRVKDDEVVSSNEGEYLADIPSKFLTKMAKTDEACFSKYQIKDDTSYLVFKVKSADFTVEQIFVIISGIED